MKKYHKPSILLAIPMYEPDERFITSLREFLKQCENKYDMEVMSVENSKELDSLVKKQNFISDYFLQNRFDYLLIMESDHWGFNRNHLKALLRANTDICAINYYSRYMPYYTCLMKDLKNSMPQNRFGHMDNTEGYHECDLMGYAMMLIKRSVFDKLEKPYFRLNKDGGKDSYATDIDFCDRCKEKGIQLIGCFNYILSHRDITPQNRMQKMIEGFEDIKKNRQEELKKKGYINEFFAGDAANS